MVEVQPDGHSVKISKTFDGQDNCDGAYVPTLASGKQFSHYSGLNFHCKGSITLE